MNEKNFLMILFVFSHSKIFHSFRDVTFAVEGLQILTHARHLCSLSSEGSLAYHTYCDNGHPFIMARNTHTYCRALGCEAVTTCFND